MEPVLSQHNRLSLPPAIIPALCLPVTFTLAVYNQPAFYPFVFGFIFGYIIQRSRFCFAACFRDIFLIRTTTLTRSLILALLLTTAGFTAVSAIWGYDLFTLGRIYPVGIHTVVGGVLFGFGMVIAGSCVSGCLVRIGEGYLMQYGTFVGLVLGSLLGAWNLNWWLTATVRISPTVFLPHVMGWPTALLLHIFLLVLLYFWMLRFEGSGDPWSIFRSHANAMSYGTGAVLLSIFHILLYILWKRPWGITSGFTHAAGWLAWRTEVPVTTWAYFRSEILSEQSQAAALLAHPLIYLSVAMVAGSLYASLRYHEFRFRRPRTYKYYLSGLLGGILMGYGSRLAFGCNIGALLSGISSMSLHGWVFAVSMLLGAALGGKALLRYLLS